MADLNITRSENILILPYNTLRIIDVPLYYDICKTIGTEIDDNLERNIYKIITRKERDMNKFTKIDDGLSELLLRSLYSQYYDLAPRTKIYEVIDVLSRQKFTSSIQVLFPDKSASEPKYDNIYYDGSIEELENIIPKYNITCIFMDDIEILKSLLTRKNVDMNNKTIMLSKIGYNYIINEEKRLVIKDYDELSKMAVMEIGVLALIQFSKETIDYFNSNKKWR